MCVTEKDGMTNADDIKRWRLDREMYGDYDGLGM